jgi:aspartate/methionine/tyrosine aminotransferase
VPAPCYPLLEHLGQLEGVTLERYPLRYDGRWNVDPLESTAKAIVAVSPGNPTGTYLSAAEAHALAARGVPLIVDEVFADPERSVLRMNLPGVTFALGGLSKAAGLPQLKLAWLAVNGPPEVFERLELIADTYLSVNGPVQHAAAALLQTDFRARVAERCAQNRACLKNLEPGWTLLDSEGGWSAVLRVPELPDEETRCLALLERGLAVQPGYFYDFPAGAHLVLSLLPQPEEFARGVALLAA